MRSEKCLKIRCSSGTINTFVYASICPNQLFWYGFVWKLSDRSNNESSIISLIFWKLFEKSFLFYLKNARNLQWHGWRHNFALWKLELSRNHFVRLKSDYFRIFQQKDSNTSSHIYSLILISEEIEDWGDFSRQSTYLQCTLSIEC